jgi:hypothetical protein
MKDKVTQIYVDYSAQHKGSIGVPVKTETINYF